MMKSLLLIFTTFTIALGQQVKKDSAEGPAGLMYGEDHAFWISAPKGWILDNSSGVSQGLHAVFYPAGGSWQNSPAVMYANTASKKAEGKETIEKFIQYDVAQFKENFPDVKISDSTQLTTQDHKKAIIKTFAYANFEAVAYIDEETIIAMLVLTARTHALFKEAFPAFRELASSYSFWTKDVLIEKE